MKIIIITLVFSIFITPNIVLADQVYELIKSIKSICLSPDQRGKYWKVAASGDAKMKIKLLGPKAEGSAEITVEEWDGIQKVLRIQLASEHKNYRDCAKFITPILLKNLTTVSVKHNTVIIKDDEFKIDLSKYDEGDIIYELGSDIVAVKVKNKIAISSLPGSEKGFVNIKNINLKKIFRLDIVNDINSRNFDIILRTRDDDIDNDIAIHIVNEYIEYAGKKTYISSAKGYIPGKNINDFVIYVKNGAAKFYINDIYYATKKIPKNVVYNTLFVKNISPVDYLFDIAGYNITN